MNDELEGAPSIHRSSFIAHHLIAERPAVGQSPFNTLGGPSHA
jgi:hypothetical protein